jgi:hypothetical protein
MRTLHGAHIWSEVSSSEFEPTKLIDQNAVAKDKARRERSPPMATCSMANHGPYKGEAGDTV